MDVGLDLFDDTEGGDGAAEGTELLDNDDYKETSFITTDLPFTEVHDPMVATRGTVEDARALFVKRDLIDAFYKSVRLEYVVEASQPPDDSTFRVEGRRLFLQYGGREIELTRAGPGRQFVKLFTIQRNGGINAVRDGLNLPGYTTSVTRASRAAADRLATAAGAGDIDQLEDEITVLAREQGAQTCPSARSWASTAS